ncbi:hypothetical protein HJD18_13530 [Thermoleophilia bacterium SCSIO 60948]|nr:hypothetical protein HJD18_13530 [Thermoleophilia bacterium SCSIO 60948]
MTSPLKWTPSSDTASMIGRAAHNLGAAAIVGGDLFARHSMHPSLAEIASPTERGKVLNTSWRRQGNVNSASLLAIVGGWAAARRLEAAPDRLSARERSLASAKDLAVGSVALSGIAAGLAGIRLARMEPGGAVPLADGDRTAPSAGPAERRTKDLIRRLSNVNLASAVALVAIDAALAQAGHRHPPVRRLLLR